MNKPKTMKAWRIVGIVVTTLLIIGGFMGAYMLGVSRSNYIQADTDWTHPMDRFNDDEYAYGRMPMYSGYRTYHNPIGGIFGFFLFVVVIGAFLRLVFFPFRMARHAMWAHRYGDCHSGHHFHHGPRGYHYGPRGEGCCGEGDEECDCDHEEEVPSEE